MLALLATLGLLALACTGPVSTWGFGYLAALLALSASAFCGRFSRRVAGLALAAFALIAAARVVVVGRSSVRLITLPGGGESGWFNRLIDEQDIGLLGAAWMPRGHLITVRESAGVRTAMREAYDEMRRARGVVPSPFARTWTLRERPENFDTVLIQPATGSTEVAVVFLHGFGGSFTLPCWVVSQAAERIGAVTACPSVGTGGVWWNDAGVRTLDATFAFLRRRGVKRIYLSGLSNGAIGAGQLSPERAREIAGLILISGAHSECSANGLPTLVLHGRSDPAIPVREAREFVRKAGPIAKLVEVPEGHFALVERRALLVDTMAEWLASQERDAAAREPAGP